MRFQTSEKETESFLSVYETKLAVYNIHSSALLSTLSFLLILIYSVNFSLTPVLMDRIQSIKRKKKRERERDLDHLDTHTHTFSLF